MASENSLMRFGLGLRVQGNRVKMTLPPLKAKHRDNQHPYEHG
jgi:hypothetical protein